MVSINSSTKNVLPSSTLGTTPTTKSATSSSIFVNDKVSSDFAFNIMDSYKALTDKYENAGVENVIILSTPNAKQIEEMTELDEDDKKLLMEYIAGDAKEAYGFYSKKAKSFVFVESNHERKDKNLEGTVAEQGADTLTHEFGHLIGNKKSETAEFRNAYLADLKEINEKLKENPNQKIGNSDMTYKEALSYFDHYIEGADFSDGINEKDVTARGARENYAEAFSVLNDLNENYSNEIFKELFSNSVNTVAFSCVA